MLLFRENMPFYKANLHTHTSQSDGAVTSEACERLYKEHGYDVLALTDHWKMHCTPHYFENMLVLPGFEADFNLPGQVIHIIAIDPDISALEKINRGMGAQGCIYQINDAGGRAILGHPAWSLNTPETICTLQGLCAAEIYNTVSGAPWNGDRADATNILDIAAAHGALLNTLATDDAHFYNGDACRAATYIQAESLTAEGIKKALDAGTYFASTGPLFHQIEVTPEALCIACSPVSRVLFLSDTVYAGERCVCGKDITTAVYPIKKDRHERFIRVRITDENGDSAWSNPIAL